MNYNVILTIYIKVMFYSELLLFEFMSHNVFVAFDIHEDIRLYPE